MADIRLSCLAEEHVEGDIDSCRITFALFHDFGDGVSCEMQRRRDVVGWDSSFVFRDDILSLSLN